MGLETSRKSRTQDSIEKILEKIITGHLPVKR